MAGYDAFISYSHDADVELAPVVRDGLQRLAKPWNRRRALSIFLDQASLEVSSELGSSLDKRIEDTRWLIVFMSEQAAQSKWVGEEIAEWAATKSKDKIALVLTAGEVVWDEKARDFDYERSTAVSAGMRGVYTGQDSEPLYYDMRWAKEVPDGEKTLDLNHPRFRDAIATVAAPIHDMHKDELEGEDVRQFKRARLLKRAAVTGLAALTVIAVVAGVVALVQRNSAIENAKLATSTALASQSENRIESEPDLAALLALEAFRTKDTVDAQGALLRVLGTPTNFLGRNAAHDAPLSAMAHHEASGTTATADLTGAVVLWDTTPEARSERRNIEVEAGGGVSSLAFNKDGSQLLIALFEGDVEIWGVGPSAAEKLGVRSIPAFDTVLSRDGSLAAGYTELDGQLGILVYDVPGDKSLQFGALDVSAEQFDQSEPTLPSFSDDSSIVAVGIGDEIHVLRWMETDEVELIYVEDLLQLPNVERLALAITTVGFVADGTRLAFGIDEGNIFVTDVEGVSGTPAIEVKPSPLNLAHALVSVTVTSESGEPEQLLASGHNNGEVKVWVVDEFSAVELYTLRGHDEETRAVAFTTSGALVSGSFDGDVIWWAAFPGAQLGDPILAAGATASHAFDVDGVEFIRDDLVVSVGAGSLKAWNPVTRTAVDGPAGDGVGSIGAAAGLIAIGWVDGSVEVIDLDDGRTIEFDSVHESEVTVLAVSEDRAMVASGDDDGTIALWDIASRALVAIVDLPDDFEVGAIAFPSRELLWLGGAIDPEEGETESLALRIDTTSGSVLQRARHNADETGHFVASIALSPDGSTLATGGTDRRIFLWDTEDLSVETAELAAHVDTVSDIIFLDDNVLLASDLDGRILMWDVDAGRPVGDLSGPSDGVTSLALHPDGTWLVAGSEDDKVWIWDLRIDTWLEGACNLAGRNMTKTEWTRFQLADDPVRHCSQFGPDDRSLATYPTDKG